MFESLKFFRQEPTEECEECLARDYLVDAIIDGKQKRICRRCLVANNAIELKKPNAIQLDTVNRPSVREAMFRASGMMPKPTQLTIGQPKLEDLRERYEEIKKKKANEQAKKDKDRELLQLMQRKQSQLEVLDSTEFLRYMEKLPKENIIIPTVQTQLIEAKKSEEIPQTQSTQLTQTPSQELSQKKSEIKEMQIKETKKEKEEFDFSIEATRHTRIRDLLEKMKRADEESDDKEKEKINKVLARKMEEKMEDADSAGYEEKI